MNPSPQLRGSALIPQAEASMPPTPPAQLDAAVARVRVNKDRWVALGVPARVALLEDLIRSTASVAPRWVAKAVQAKGIVPGSAPEGEEWLAGPTTVIRNLRLLA